jgi:hypothetical protein
MTWNDHDHRGRYADDNHDHYDYAREHHRHYYLENDDEKASRRITALQDEVDGLRGQLAGALGRIGALENANLRLAAALRASVVEHDAVRATAMASEAHLAVSGELADAFTAFADALEGAPGDEPEPEPEEYDPGPEADDEGGMSEYRYLLPEDYQRGLS